MNIFQHQRRVRVTSDTSLVCFNFEEQFGLD